MRLESETTFTAIILLWLPSIAVLSTIFYTPVFPRCSLCWGSQWTEFLFTIPKSAPVNAVTLSLFHPTNEP